ncbi:MAG: RNA polymerase factor sigma-32 [Polyangiaceae bacterium]|nr:RNA polymerase factor sigma-32 [Polyangiaceae bacterium]
MKHSSESAVNHYITAVKHLPALSRAEELELTTVYAKTGDTQAKDKLIQTHLRYVVAIALKYRRYGVPVAELIGEGNFGLLHALTKFDPERGFRFVTYAAYWIRAYVLNYVIRSWSMVGVGSGALRSKMFFKLRRERVRLLNLVGEPEKADELLAQQLKLPTEKVKDMVRRLEQRDLSLDAKVFDDSGATLGDSLPAMNENQEEVASNNERQGQIQSTVNSALGVLDERERFIVNFRLMADNEDALSLAEIGRRLGVSRERARQLETRAKRKLRGRIEELSGSAPQSWVNDAA